MKKRLLATLFALLLLVGTVPAASALEGGPEAVCRHLKGAGNLTFMRLRNYLHKGKKAVQ